MLLISCFALFGCGKEETPPSLIRWTEPAQIESLESEHLDLLEGKRFVFFDKPPYALFDLRSDWYPFYQPSELGKAEAAANLPPMTREFPAQAGRIQLAPHTGLAHVVAIDGPGRLAITCKGDFKPSSGLKAAIVDLKSLQSLPENPTHGALKKLITDFGRGTFPLQPSEDGAFASRLFTAYEENRALVLMVLVSHDQTAGLEWARIDYLSPWEEWLLARKETGIPHPAVASASFVEGTVRPSLLIPPRTSVKMKPFEIPPESRFCCALGVKGNFRHAVEVEMTGAEPGGETHEIFCRRLEPGPEEWFEIEQDLSGLAGRTMSFRFECAWAEQGVAKQSPPLVFCGAPILYSKVSAPHRERFNLVLISLDTLRADRLGCYGYESPVSPIMDALAAGSCFFERAYAHAPYTHASHASMFTALYPSAHGVQSGNDMLGVNLDLLAERLARQGWATASFNCGGLISHEFGFHRGFDLYCEIDPIGDQYTDGEPVNPNSFADGGRASLNRAFSWLESMQDRPFFLFLHTFMVHDYRPPMALAETFNSERPGGLELGLEIRSLMNMERFRTKGLSQAELRYLNNMYDATIRAADIMVGKVIDRLKALNLYDRTILVVTSDHGEEFLEHGSIGHSKSVFDESIRIPLIVRAPGLPAGVKVDSFVSHVDFLPTVLELLEVPCTGPIQGKSYLPLMRGRKESDYLVFAEVDLPKRSQRACIVMDGWKYIEGNTDADLKFPAADQAMLFNLYDDPGERNNRIEQNPREAKNLLNMLRTLQGKSLEVHESLGGDEGSTQKLSESLKQMLREQGYL